MSQGKLYIIATPLGNRNDMTVRAKETLEKIIHLFAEDTRELKKLLELSGITVSGKKMFSYASHNMKRATEQAMGFLEAGHDVAFVSDRGTPCISDPGTLLVQRAHEACLSVIPIPGPSAVASALSVSGFVADHYLFLGFLPHEKNRREELWDRVQKCQFTTCFFESPHRIEATLRELAERFPSGNVFLAREMTKMFETYQKFSLVQLSGQNITRQGEFTVVFEPGGTTTEEVSDLTTDISLRISSERDWSKAMARRHKISAKDAYNALQKNKI